MKILYTNINPNKLHDELIKTGITPILVMHDAKKGECISENAWITFADNTDMTAAQAVVNAHDPTPLPPVPTLEQRNRADIDYIGMMSGGAVMDWFEKIKTYYGMGLWDIDRVKNAVTMGKITGTQFSDITDTVYAA